MGRQVTDLTRDDFEIREEGELQQITNLLYVGTAPAPSSTEPGKRSNNRETREVPAPPPTRLRADQVARTMAVLVDDDIMSFASVGATHDALKEFIDQRIEPNGLVGIFRTARSNTLLQQFTTDRNQLALAVRRLVWLPGQNNSINVFAAVHSEVTLGQNGRVVNEFTRTHTVRIGPATIPFVRENGLIYSADVPVKSSGAYQFRIVVRDANSNKFGTASQFIEIPDLKKNRRR